MIELPTLTGEKIFVEASTISVIYHYGHSGSEINIGNSVVRVGLTTKELIELLKPKNPELEAAVKYYKWLVRLSFENGYRSAGGVGIWENEWENSKAKGKLDG